MQSDLFQWLTVLTTKTILFIFNLIQCKCIFFGPMFRKDGIREVIILCIENPHIFEDCINKPFSSRLNNLCPFRLWNGFYIPTVNHPCSSSLNTLLILISCGFHNDILDEDSVPFFFFWLLTNRTVFFYRQVSRTSESHIFQNTSHWKLFMCSKDD